MNLVSDEWIPVVMPDGKPATVSLAELYGKAEQIRDLACSPPQRIALMRLLICIVQAALDGPENDEAWWDCRDRIAPSSLAYLGRWRHAFNLRGEQPFLQIPDLRVDSGKHKPLDLLDCRLSSGNNPTLFDHDAAESGRALTEGEQALNLITFLNFSAGGKVGQANWAGTKYSHSTFMAPCADYVHTFVRGQNLLETLHFNLLTKNGEIAGVTNLPNGKWGRPVWECFPRGVSDKAAFENAAETYLGRLAPLSRFVILKGETLTQCIVGPTHKSYRIDHLPAFREPSATVVQVKEQDRYLKIASSKHAWRQLGSLLSLKQTTCGTTGALSLANVVYYYEDLPETEIDVWVGGIQTGAGGGKIIDMLEWCFSVPISQFGETRLHKYVTGVELADTGEKLLGGAVKRYSAEMHVDPKQVPYGNAKQRYWSDLDGRCAVLIRAANDPHAFLHDTWYPVVRKAMNEAYAAQCPHQTPRQIEAFAKGQQALRLRKPEE